jgi:threonine dehydratase
LSCRAPTPAIKVQAVRGFGAKAVLHGDSYDEAYAQAMEWVAERGLTFIHPFDDPEVIAGQGTIAMEILRQHPQPLHAVYVPVGGGGLIAGIAAYIKYVRPEVKVIGVEPEDAPHPLQCPGGGSAGGTGAGGDCSPTAWRCG